MTQRLPAADVARYKAFRLFDLGQLSVRAVEALVGEHEATVAMPRADFKRALEELLFFFTVAKISKKKEERRTL